MTHEENKKLISTTMIIWISATLVGTAACAWAIVSGWMTDYTVFVKCLNTLLYGFGMIYNASVTVFVIKRFNKLVKKSVSILEEAE